MYLCLFLTEKVNFIDLEFSSYNYQAFDIAMHFCDYTGNDFNTVIHISQLLAIK